MKNEVKAIWTTTRVGNDNRCHINISQRNYFYGPLWYSSEVDLVSNRIYELIRAELLNHLEK